MKLAFPVTLGAVSVLALASLPARAVEIEVATAPAIFQKAYEEVVAAFEKEFPDIDVNLLPSKREDEELFQTVLRGVITGEVPDLIFINPNLLRPIVERDLAVPLSKLGATEAEIAGLGMIDGATGVAKVGDDLFGLPYGVTTPIIAYNTDLVRKAGGDPDNFPTTWSGTVELVQNIAKLEPKVLGGFFEYDNTGNFTFQGLLGSLGGNMMEPDDKTVAFAGPAGVEAFKILHDFGAAGQAAQDMTRDQARQAFAAGTVGLIVSSSGALLGMEKLAAGQIELKTAPYPVSGPEGRVPAAGTVMIALSQDAEKQKAVWELMKFAASPEAQTIMGKNSGLLSISKTALEDPNLLANQLVERPNLKAVVDSLGRLKEWYAFPGENSQKITVVIRDHLQSVLTNKKSPEDELAATKADVEALLPK